MKGLSRITWDEKFTVHNEILDAQHRKLFDITNHLIEVYESGSGSLLEVISDLIDYLSYHFHAEHMVMKDANYPGLLQQSEAHSQFTDQIQEFLKRYRENDTDLEFEMLSFLRNWIREHTLDSDTKYGKYLLDAATRQK